MGSRRIGWAAVFVAAAVALPDRVAGQEIDVVEMTTVDVLAGYAAGDFTAVELTRAFLARIARYESHYNAFISMNPDVRAIAAALDVEYAGSGPRGPLHGVPVVIKDNIDYGGLVTTAGWEGFSSAAGGVDMVPDDDAAVVTRLRAAGAIILGKTNLPDFASHGTRTNSTVAGQTLNPYNVDKVPGGSSGGTATAVNGSFAVLGLGSETGGSIQNPASAQGLVGVKVTYGLVPIEGVVPLSGTYIDVVGPIAKTVYDAAVTLDEVLEQIVTSWKQWRTDHPDVALREDDDLTDEASEAITIIGMDHFQLDDQSPPLTVDQRLWRLPRESQADTAGERIHSGELS